MKGFTTKAIHARFPKKDTHNALRMPIYDSVSFEFDSALDIQMAFEGKRSAHTYSRITNPTVEDFENRVRVLSGGLGVIAVSSGMAAIANVIMTLGFTGANLVTTRHLFGNTISLLEHSLQDWGMTIRYVDMTNPDNVSEALDDNTCAVFLETITNPQLEVADFKALSKITRSKGVPLVVDGTLTTPYVFSSKLWGVDIEVISSTKYMSGGATSVGGVIIDNGTFKWVQHPKLGENGKKFGPYAFLAKLRREVYRNFGAALSPQAAFLQSLGLETLAIRIDRSCENALRIAIFLCKHDKVLSVHYPGLKDSPFHELAKEQFCGRYGGLLTFSLENRERCFRLIDSLALIRRATNLNDNKTLALHPASTIFSEYPLSVREEMGVGEGLIRIAVGIEDTDDIINDLKQGLETL